MQESNIKRVLIPTDFSENSINAARYAFKIFEHRPDVEFVLLNAYDIPHGGSNTMLVSITDILRQDSEVGLKETLKMLSYEIGSRKVDTLSVHGGLNEVIDDLLTKQSFELIVMGTKGAGGIKKVLLGSNTSEVVREINLPILIVPNGVLFNRPKKMLLTTDFKPTPRNIQLERLLEFTRTVEAEINILNIHNGKKEVDLEQAKIHSGLEELLGDVPHVYYERVNDNIIYGIDSFVKEMNIDIISMIIRKTTFFASLFHKSLTKEMAMHTEVPMLVLHD